MPHSGETLPIEPVILSFTEQSLIGSKMGDVVLKKDIPWIIDLYQQQRLRLNELISNRWRLEQVNVAIADTKSSVIVF